MVCDSDFYAQKPLDSKVAEYHNLSQNVKQILVAGDSVGESVLFEAEVNKVDAFSL